MKMLTARTVIFLFLFAVGVSAQSATPPNPILVLSGTEDYESGGKQWTRYVYFVFNREAYTAELFAPAPDLPPCGANANSSRTWIDMFDQRGKRLYGFCAFQSPANLKYVWFALGRGELPPSWVYLQMTDRKTGATYRSNLAETTL